jgi:cytosine/uracil/thiamine/allantoin permease
VQQQPQPPPAAAAVATATPTAAAAAAAGIPFAKVSRSSRGWSTEEDTVIRNAVAACGTYDSMLYVHVHAETTLTEQSLHTTTLASSSCIGAAVALRRAYEHYNLLNCLYLKCCYL